MYGLGLNYVGLFDSQFTSAVLGFVMLLLYLDRHSFINEHAG